MVGVSNSLDNPYHKYVCAVLMKKGGWICTSRPEFKPNLYEKD